MVTVKFDATAAAAAYTRAFRTLHNLPGFDPQAALLAEAGVILKTWAGRTKVATASEVETRARMRALYAKGFTRGDITINVGRRGQKNLIWHRSSTARSFAKAKRGFQLVGRMVEGGHIVANWYHYRDQDWRDIDNAAIDADRAITEQVRKGERSVGLARQSVVQIADDLGIDLLQVKGGGGLSAAGVAKARAALASSGAAYKNGTGLKGGDRAKSFVDLLCRLPYAHELGMDRTLAGVLQGRAKFIATTYEKGAFNSFSQVARAFPEIIRLKASTAPSA